MNRSSLGGALKSRIWIVLGASLIVVAGLLLLVAFLRPGSAAPEQDPTEERAEATTAVPASPTPTPEPSPTEPAIVASVNDYTITREYLEEATALNQVLSKLAGQAPLGEAETLQRLISQQLVLQGAPSEVEITDAHVESYIDRMQEAWRVDEERMVAELEAAGVERPFLEETIHRLLTVQTAAQALSQDGEDVEAWLNERREAADIQFFVPTSELSPAPTVTSEVNPTREEPTSPPETSSSRTPAAQQPVIPESAPDFTLERAGGGTLTLSDQLEEGPVVLVFFERCG